MKKFYSILFFLMLLSLPMAAQVKIGYFSHDAALKSMPEYQQMQADLQTLREQYDEEVKRSEEEFNAKYEEFLSDLSSLSTSIRRKRQNEIQQLMDSNIKFRDESRRLLRQAEDDATEPLQKKLSDAVSAVAKENALIVVLNTDSDACPYIDPEYSVDINSQIQEELKK